MMTELSTFPTRPYAPAQEHAPRDDALDLYSLVPYLEDYQNRARTRRCFITDDSKSEVSWTDVDGQGPASVRVLNSLAELRGYRSLHCPQRNDLRVISVCQSNSWRPLSVTCDMFKEIVDAVSASPDLLELPLSFYQKTIAVEEGFTTAPVFRLNASSMEIMYIIKYAFQKPFEEKGKDNWVLRQTGVYQKYDIATKNSTLVFLNPTRECKFQERLMGLLQSPYKRTCLQRNPLLVHNILFGTFFHAWRDYLKHLEGRILPIVSSLVDNFIIS
ncbi:hypothetical protein ASPCAL07763 [Aspergillus calidoustus]|uniref:CorA-like transporter domain-containing protein n=1 Tax=Aspergillus calidoustus TaxID=454130 RepID=A0A0U5GQD9_ASPCI|nr:hypothetical protein ASPCAL07763 [Aspergillus calidoustus]